MKQIENGIFSMEESMPCSPKDFGLALYALPSTLNRAEREEAAARILSFSKKLGQWVGVSWTRLAEMMQADYEAHQTLIRLRQNNAQKQETYLQARRNYILLSLITLGIYALFASKPVMELQEPPSENLPFSGIYVFGPNHVITGIHELVDSGMLKREEIGEGDGALDVFFPTPSLIQRIMEVQKIAPTMA